MKKLFIILLTFMLVASSFCVQADYIYEANTSKKIAPSITYREHRILTDTGWLMAYVAMVDLEDPNAKIGVMTAPDGSSYLATVREMAKNEGAALAINGDFFNVTTGQTNMLGMTYKDSELISSPAPDNMPSFVITEGGEIIMDYFSFEGTVFSPQGYSCPLYQINKKPSTGGAITLLTRAWAKMTPEDGLEALIVEQDRVSAIKSADSAAMEIPEEGYVLVTNPEVNGFFTNFEIGDTVSLDIKISPDIESIKEATGGNTILVQDGKVYDFTNNITGYAQRSAVGVTKDSKTLILATTDGRTTACPGLTQTQMAQFMIYLGADKAINLDGGGSSTLALKNPDGSYSVKNSVGYERKVSTSIGVFVNQLIGQKASHGTLTPSQKTIVKGDKVSFDAVFYDEFENVYAHNAAKTRLYDQNGKTIDGFEYVPQVGKHTIYAELDDVVLKTEIEAVDELFAIDAGYETAELGKGESLKLNVYGYTADGQKTLIDPSLVHFISSSDNVTAKDGKITSVTGEGAIITVSYGNLLDFVNVNKGSSKLKAPPSVYGSDKFEKSFDGKKVAISGNVPEGETLLNKLFSIKRLEEIAKFDKAFVTTTHLGESLEENTKNTDAFSKTMIEGTLFVTLPTSKGYVSSGSDWAKLGKALREDAKNIVIISEFSPDRIRTTEAPLLRELLSDAVQSGKNVFYVSSGETSKVKIEDGVRYITCGMVADYTTTNIKSNDKTCPYVVFSLDKDKIGFEFE